MTSHVFLLPITLNKRSRIIENKPIKFALIQFIQPIQNHNLLSLHIFNKIVKEHYGSLGIDINCLLVDLLMLVRPLILQKKLFCVQRN
jgi:hypothetical protein